MAAHYNYADKILGGRADFAADEIIVRICTIEGARGDMGFFSPATIIAGSRQVEVVAQWDTGANTSCISPRVAQTLHLAPISTTIAASTTSELTTNVYVADLVISPNIRIAGVRVVEVPIDDNGNDLLIGMDVISMGDLAISNYDGRPTLSFRIPSLERTDYTQQ